MISTDDLMDRTAALYAPQCQGTLSLQGPSGGYLLHLAWPETAPPANGWPVLFLLDGETLPVVRELLRYQAGASPNDPHALPVLAAVAHDGPSRRALDYTPAGSMAGAARFGGADAFRQFLLGPVLQAVADRLPVDGSRYMLAGHSLGGVFALDTLFGGHSPFTRFIVSSPSVWWDGGALLSRVAHFADGQAEDCPGAAASSPSPIHINLSVAEFDQALSPAEQTLPDAERQALHQTRQARRMIEDIGAIAARLGRMHGLTVSFNTLDGETHRSAWPRAVAQALRWHRAC